MHANSTFTLTLIILCSFFVNSCNLVQQEEEGFDITFDVLDKDANELHLSVRGYYTLSNFRLNIIKKEYGSYYKESLIKPTIQSISRDLLAEYAAGDIYTYKRKELEQEITNQIRTSFNSNSIELTEFHISSVELSDKLRARLEKEHVERLNQQNN